VAKDNGIYSGDAYSPGRPFHAVARVGQTRKEPPTSKVFELLHTRITWILLTNTVSGGSDRVSMNDIIVKFIDRGRNDFEISRRVGECLLSSLMRSVLTILVPDIIVTVLRRNDVQFTMSEPWCGVPMKIIPVVDSKILPYWWLFSCAMMSAWLLSVVDAEETGCRPFSQQCPLDCARRR
jgi:hypothetical protein